MVLVQIERNFRQISNDRIYVTFQPLKRNIFQCYEFYSSIKDQFRCKSIRLVQLKQLAISAARNRSAVSHWMCSIIGELAMSIIPLCWLNRKIGCVALIWLPINTVVYCMFSAACLASYSHSHNTRTLYLNPFVPQSLVFVIVLGCCHSRQTNTTVYWMCDFRTILLLICTHERLASVSPLANISRHRQLSTMSKGKQKNQNSIRIDTRRTCLSKQPYPNCATNIQ